MVKVKKKWLIAGTFTVAIVSAITLSLVSNPKVSFSVPNYKQIFLNYVPPDEAGSPHDMEWIVENFIGDGGYYGTKYFPGTLTTQEHTDITITNQSKTPESIDASGNTQYKTAITYITPLNHTDWNVDWNFNEFSADFIMYQDQKTQKWVVGGANKIAVSILQSAVLGLNPPSTQNQ